LLQGHHRHTFVLLHPVGIAAAELLPDDPHVGLGGLNSDAGLQSRGDEQIVALVSAVGIGLQRDEDIGGRIGFECGRQDSDYGGGFTADIGGPADHVRIGTEVRFPKLIAEDRDARTIGRVFIGCEGAAKSGCDAEDAEELGGNVDTFDLLGAVAAAEA